MQPMFCFCGHDCGRCLVYLATLRKDEVLRRRAQAFLCEAFGLSLPLDSLHCRGGRSADCFALCLGCPFRRCATERGLFRCADCTDYPCPALADYTARYVNRVGQVSAAEAQSYAKGEADGTDEN